VLLSCRLIQYDSISLTRLLSRLPDVNIGSWAKDANNKESVRKSTYVKYLGMAIGKPLCLVKK
jgi:hypothetical protein